MKKGKEPNSRRPVSPAMDHSNSKETPSHGPHGGKKAILAPVLTKKEKVKEEE